MAKVFGLAHLLYILISIAILVPLGILLKKKVKTEKGITIMFRILGLIGLIVIIINRIALAICEDNILALIPNTFCGLTSFLISIGLLFFGKDNNLLHAVWLLGIIGCVATYAYPDFVEESDTILYAPTITSFLHHAITLFDIILLFMFKYIKITYKKMWVQALGIVLLLGAAFILAYPLHIPDSFYLLEPAISDTPLYFGLLLPIYLVIYVILVIVIELIRKRKEKENTKENGTI